ncbi:uncharacterized protein LOC103383704 isoform X2 [Cynoglossus semilaevis]|uniref:uncharacterized protein LOC103383704 isoform X2 n=1 Tax=Cynoglossus semilaevis TaxID=244447 RepID=UPI0004986182|nr:uncharacterized protein LOC103383704 isoform X2 [Cynoglossus semilaevis]
MSVTVTVTPTVSTWPTCYMFLSHIRVLKTNFHCLPCQHCEHQIQQNTGGNRDAGLGEVKEKDVCDCSQISELNMLERCCEQWNLNNTDYSLSNYTADRGGLAKNVFICQTDVDMTEIHNNTLSSGTAVHLQVSVELQLDEAQTLNLTFQGDSHYGNLVLYSAEQPEADEEDGGETDERPKVFYCCAPVPPTSESASQGRCLLWLTNQTLFTTTAEEKLPWKRQERDEWQCILLVLWLALLCVILLTVVSTVLQQIFLSRGVNRKPAVHTVHSSKGQQFNGSPPKVNSYRRKSELSPIEEAYSQENIQTQLDEELSHGAQLHLRGQTSTRFVKEAEGNRKKYEGYTNC